MGQKLTLAQEVEIAAKAGYDAIEPWVPKIADYEKAGGSLKDIAKKIADLGLIVPDAIGFAPWIVDDAAKRAAGLEQAKHDMDLVRQIGGTHIAAPPAGATDVHMTDLLVIAERYRALIEIGHSIGILPQLEVWGFSKTLSRLGEVAEVAIESGHPDACILADIYHLRKGKSGFAGLKALGPSALHIFHVNDYPENIPVDKLQDADRVYPTNGDAPMAEIFNNLRSTGATLVLSLELFNRDYWKQDPQIVATTGLQKLKAAAAKA